MQRCLVKDVLEWVAPNVEDAGVCVTTESGKNRAIRAIDLAQEAIVKRIDTAGLLWDFTVPVCGGCFALPEDCKSDRQIFVNGFTAIGRDQWYLGKLCSGRNHKGDCYGQRECIDLGEFPIPIPLPKVHGIRIALLTENIADAGLVCTVEVVNQYGNRVAEDLVLNVPTVPVSTASMAYDVTLFRKPKTAGRIQLQLQYDNGQRFYHCSYNPQTQFGQFRRKQLPVVATRGCNLVTILGKLRTYRITSEDDILPFDDRMAWKWGVSAVAAADRKDMENYNANLAWALQELQRAMQDDDPAGNVANATFVSGFSSNPSLAGGNCRGWW